MNAGNPISPTGPCPTAATSRSSTGSMITRDTCCPAPPTGAWPAPTWWPASPPPPPPPACRPPPSPTTDRSTRHRTSAGLPGPAQSQPTQHRRRTLPHPPPCRRPIRQTHPPPRQPPAPPRHRPHPPTHPRTDPGDHHHRHRRQQKPPPRPQQPPRRPRPQLLAQPKQKPRPLAGESVTHDATHLSPMTRLITAVSEGGLEPPRPLVGH